MLLALTACSSDKTAQPMTPAEVWQQPTAPEYRYPIQNAYAATVIAVPPELKLDYSDVPKPDEQEITLFPERHIPEGFWYDRGLRYSEMLQDHPAPVIYVIAGTGADYHAEKMHVIGNIFYTAGYHVVLLPSTTHQNFIINASTNDMVGRPQQSAQDMYRVIQAIDKKLAEKTTVTGHLLTGYSLGALDAAFTAALDDDEHKLNFSRILLINPPLNLYSSMNIINNMLYHELPNGMDDADHFINTALLRLSSTSQSGDALDFSNERALVDAYEKYKPDDAKLAATIGLSFRLSSASMVFTTDVMHKTGYVFPKDREFTTGTELTHSMALALRTSFTDYFNEYYVRRMIAQYPGTTKEAILAEGNLSYLNSYLNHNPKFGLITNRDDIILAPGEVDTLSAMFAPNAWIFPNGGHVGNLAYPTIGYYMVHFMKGDAQ